MRKVDRGVRSCGLQESRRESSRDAGPRPRLWRAKVVDEVSRRPPLCDGMRLQGHDTAHKSKGGDGALELAGGVRDAVMSRVEASRMQSSRPANPDHVQKKSAEISDFFES
jgi:hypothetical protein